MRTAAHRFMPGMRQPVKTVALLRHGVSDTEESEVRAAGCVPEMRCAFPVEQQKQSADLG